MLIGFSACQHPRTTADVSQRLFEVMRHHHGELLPMQFVVDLAMCKLQSSVGGVDDFGLDLHAEMCFDGESTSSNSPTLKHVFKHGKTRSETLIKLTGSQHHGPIISRIPFPERDCSYTPQWRTGKAAFIKGRPFAPLKTPKPQHSQRFRVINL